MQFNSYIFILAFLPLLLIVYFLANRFSYLAGKLVLIAAGIVYYYYAGLEVFLIFLASMAFNLCFSLLTEHRKRKNKSTKAVLAAAVCLNILLLLYFKYLNFFLSAVNSLFHTGFIMQKIILPLGISFFTFQQIMYLVNLHRGTIQKVNILDYMSYILYFPKIVMGPLTEPVFLIDQINDPALKRVNWNNIACGLKTFSFGLFKKMILADTFSAAVTWGFSNLSRATSMDWFLVMFCYAFEIYFDFSGFIDMAVGVSQMLNIELPQNFNSPYKALSIRDFWKRWHMSLTGFFTRYVYIPLGGSKKGTFRTCLNTMIVFVVSGIWHGANWTYILWGILHGAFSIFDRFTDTVQNRIFKAVRWFGTMIVGCLLWLLFRAESIGQWWHILGRMFRFSDMSVSGGLLNSFHLPETSVLTGLFHMESVTGQVRGFWMMLFMLAAYGICLLPDNNYNNRHKNTWGYLVLAVLGFVWGFLALSSESVFVYFNF